MRARLKIKIQSRHSRMAFGILYYFVQFNDSAKRTYGNIFRRFVFPSTNSTEKKKANKRRMKICSGSNVSNVEWNYFSIDWMPWMCKNTTENYFRFLVCTMNGAVQREQVLFFTLCHIQTTAAARIARGFSNYYILLVVSAACFLLLLLSFAALIALNRFVFNFPFLENGIRTQRLSVLVKKQHRQGKEE